MSNIENAMSENIFISICIPAYKHTNFLKRLLDSITIQTFKDFEVIVTDDSPDSSVEKLCDQYRSDFQLSYHRNHPALGTPENWNESIRRANGKWIKLMHDDDWFADERSLFFFVEVLSENKSSDFAFSAYTNVPENGVRQHISLDRFRWKQLLKNPNTLLSKNIIGPPSVVMHERNLEIFYDKQLKWLVDIDFYISFLQKTKPVYINKPLVNIGIHEKQVTRESSLVREVEIPEYFYVLNKKGAQSLRNILVFDAWWRLMRNLKIVDVRELLEAGYSGSVPYPIQTIIKFQKHLPRIMLSVGLFSKFFMMITYLLVLTKIPKNRSEP